MKLRLIQLLLNLVLPDKMNFKLQKGFTLIETILTLLVLGISLTTIFALQTNLMKSVFGTHFTIEHLIGVRNFLVEDDQEQYFKKGQKIEKIVEDYLILYEPQKSAQVPLVSKFKNVVVEKIKIKSQNLLSNQEEFVFFRFNSEGQT